MKKYGVKKVHERSEYQIDQLDKLNDRFNRWHDKQINLLSFLINLFFSFSLAAIGFIVKNFKSDLFEKETFCSLYVGRTAIIMLFVSMLLGLLALLYRLRNFRLTKEKIKYRKYRFKLDNDLVFYSNNDLSDENIKQKIINFDERIRRSGIITWNTFYLQITVFIVSVLFILIHV